MHALGFSFLKVNFFIWVLVCHCRSTYLASFRPELLNSTREKVPSDKPAAGGRSSNM